jgi:DNA-binding response OmpR family regulator
MKPVKVLIVEDDPAHAKVLRWNLTVAGYLVAEAHNGVEAPQILKEEPPELMLLDLSMPEKNGLVLLAEMAEMQPRPPTRVVVMTAHRSTPVVVEAMRLGASDVLIKPIRSQELRTSLAAVLEPANAAETH